MVCRSTDIIFVHFVCTNRRFLLGQIKYCTVSQLSKGDYVGPIIIIIISVIFFIVDFV